MLLTARFASAFASQNGQAEQPAEGLASIPGDTTGVAGAARTILLVEDDAVVRHVVRLLLEMEGDTVLEAKDGEEALELLASHRGPLDLLLTDIMMPGLSGAEVCERVRADRPGLPTLFISGFYPEAVFPAQRLPEGAAFLAKPFMPEELVEAVDDLLCRVFGYPRRSRTARPQRVMR